MFRNVYLCNNNKYFFVMQDRDIISIIFESYFTFTSEIRN